MKDSTYSIALAGERRGPHEPFESVLRFRVAVLTIGHRGPPHPSPLPEERVNHLRPHESLTLRCTFKRGRTVLPLLGERAGVRGTAMSLRRHSFIALITAGAMMLLAGCSSTKQYFEQAKANPSLAGGAIRVTTRKFDATVASVNADHRAIALRTKAGTHEYRVSNVVKNFSQVIPGTEVKAKVVDEDALFFGNTPLPAAGPVVSDFKTTIHELDRSYRLITLNYPNGERRDFKVPLGTQLEHVNPGDAAVVRSTVPIVVELKGK